MDSPIIFYYTDEFDKCFKKEVNKRFFSEGQAKKDRKMRLALGEMMLIKIYYHYSG